MQSHAPGVPVRGRDCWSHPQAEASAGDVFHPSGGYLANRAARRLAWTTFPDSKEQVVGITGDWDQHITRRTLLKTGGSFFAGVTLAGLDERPRLRAGDLSG
jgi:hypothetical protein